MADLGDKSAHPATLAKTDTAVNSRNSELGQVDNGTSDKDQIHDGKAKDSKGKKPGSLHFFFRVHWSYSTSLDHALRLIGLIAAIASGILPPLMTVVFGSSVNQFNDYENGTISGQDLYRNMSKNALWLLYLFIGRFFLVYMHSTCFGLVGIRVTRAFRVDFIRSMIRQDVSFIDSCAPGTVASTISNSADMVENGSTEKVGSLIQNMSMFVAAFVVAFTRQWKLTLVTATSLPILFIGFKITFGLDAKIEAKILEIYNRAGGLVEEALGSTRIVTAYNASAKLSRKYDDYLAGAQKLGFRKGPVIGVQWSVEFFTIYCAYSLAWFYGVKLLNSGEIGGGGQIISVLLAVLLGTNAASNVAPGFGDFAKASAAAQGMFEVVDRKSEIDPLADTGERPDKCEGLVELRNISFAYPSRPSVQVLRDASLIFEAGKVTALVGASGSGKSTIVGLVERWFNPNSGSIHLDGHNIADLDLRWLRGRIGLVQQEPVLFSDTIYNNVVHGLYGTPMNDLPEPEKRELVRQACIQAFADEFIQELPQKYDTKVGERGALLSGGQKQRVAIARSVISNPQILLLDEATSALDPTAERKVQASLDNVSKQRTTIMIAHKLSTVQKADKIVVLSRGEVVEQGTHQQLLDLRGAYHELVNAQTLDTGEAAAAHAGMETYESSKVPYRDDSSVDSAEDKPAVLSKSASRQSRPAAEPVEIEQEIKDEDADVSRKLSIAECLKFIIWKEHWHIWPIWLFGILSSAAGGGLFPAQAVLFGSSLPTLQLLPGNSLVERGNFWALMYFVFSLGVFVCYLGVGFFWTIASFHTTRFYRRGYFDAMLRQDVSFFDTTGHGASEMTSRLSLHPQRLQNLLSTNLALIIVIFVDIVSCFVLAVAMGWRLGLVVIAGGMPTLFGAGFFRLRLEMANEDRLTQTYLESARFASEAVGAIRTVSSLTLEDKVLNGFKSRLDECASRELRSKMITMVVHAFAESINMAVTGLAFWYGGKLLSEGHYDMRTFFIVFMAVLMGSQSGGVLFGFSSNVSRAHSAANHIIDLRLSQPPINTSSGVKEMPESENNRAAIEFRDVTFAYPSRPNRSVLHGLNLKILRGQSVGIVGASGCGKSTIVALLERFYDIDSGQLLVEGTTIRDLDVQFHRSRIGLVSQDTALFQGSIRDNILLGLPDDEAAAPDADDRVERACRSANMHDFISSLPDGYATDVGNRGVALSGGQRQRLAIARALIREPEVLLFDEATSALDTANEVLVQAAIEAVAREKPGRTTIAVAHRLSTIQRCDRIFVLHRGQVAEDGTHEELFQRRGMYYEMVLAQSLDREVVAIV
ncbi:multidrug resistance protein [Colletotrichum scovillei]|uniref:Multidrug resistance protein n=1 Tax=Colletotrichum scovillei TaxID=1209932 RepID=A0A9P7R1A4_9PEZI|nr:multidrug resistance protein [Colletotrichum scovillei]KAG7056235.1 multidrug resistance protein [Colletotrichum scovillei]KAG7066165.1 multidrug resistance protein [Colletotrichum scovillei]